MKPYLDLMRRILENGARKGDRTGTGTLSLFAEQLRFDLCGGFPLVTTKRVHLRSVICELLWFLRGDTNIAWLNDQGVTIWDEWADERGELGPVYGKQWRAWLAPDGRTVDQIRLAIEQLRSNPDPRRILISAWNVGELEQMNLMPRPLSVLRGRRAPLLSALPAQRRCLPRRTVQHRELRAAHSHVRPAVRPR